MKAVITGLGVAAPNGIGTEAYWAATLAGQSGIGPITFFDATPYPVRLAGEVTGLSLAGYIPRKLRAQADHVTHLALAATMMALDDAGVDPAQQSAFDMGVIAANSSGGIMYGERGLQRLWSQGPAYVSAYMSIACFYAATAGQISIRHGMRGPCLILTSEQAGGVDAAGHARRQVRRGTPLVVTGGTDASLSPGGLASQIATRMLSPCPDPARAYVPFDAAASGYVLGIGGAMLLLESETNARQRGATRIYGELAGYAATFDPANGDGEPEGPAEPHDPPRGAGRFSRLGRAAELALADAQVAPEQVDVVFADAWGRAELDRAEAEAITGIFGPFGVPVTAPKSMTGRLYAAGGALDLITALLAMRDSVLPPTINVTSLAPGCDIDLVTGAPREKPVQTALVLARGLGGFNAAAVLTSVN